MKLELTIDYDHDAECPSDGECEWRLYSFNSRHTRFRHPDEVLTDELRPKLESGLAHVLSYYEHGLCRWSLKGEGPVCRWDSVGVAGVLVWEDDENALGPTTYEDRADSARRFCEDYTEWANGNCYGYGLRNAETGETLVDFHVGYIGDECLIEEVRASLEDYPDAELEVTGSAKWVADYHEFKPEGSHH